jgi:hypothetical protein
VLRSSGALVVVALAIVLAGCRGSHSSAPTTTETVPTLPKSVTQLAVKSFPASLAGNLTFNIDRTQGNPKQPGGSRRNYVVKLSNVQMHLANVQGTGAKRTARYNLVSADESFSGYEDLTNSKCQTTHIVWGGSGHAPTGAIAVYGPKFDSRVGFIFLVPQRGRTLTRPCGATTGGTPNTVTRTARIVGFANLKLKNTKAPSQRFAIGIQIESSTAGSGESGGYTINGSLKPPDSGTPVQICKQHGDKLTCPA